MKRTVIMSAAALLMIVASLVYFVWLRPAGEEPKARAEESKTAAPEGAVVAPGVVEPASEEIEVAAQIGGRLREVMVDEGSEVVAGQIVAVIENSDFAAQVDSAKTQIATLERQKDTAATRLLEAEAARERIRNGARREERTESRAAYERSLPDVENARREFERRRRLFESGDVSREELERARTALENAEKEASLRAARLRVVDADARPDDLNRADAAVGVAAAQLREFDALIGEARSRVRTAEANLEKTFVRAPISGVVLRKRLKSGESVSPESPTGIITIADVSSLRVRIDLDERDVARVREGQSVYVTADAYGDRRFAGRIARIGQILGRKNFRTEKPTEKVDTRILEVLVDLDPGQTLPLGLRVDAFVEAVNREGVTQ